MKHQTMSPGCRLWSTKSPTNCAKAALAIGHGGVPALAKHGDVDAAWGCRLEIGTGVEELAPVAGLRHGRRRRRVGRRLDGVAGGSGNGARAVWILPVAAQAEVALLSDNQSDSSTLVLSPIMCSLR